MSRGEPTALELLDLSNAFDTIDHSTLFSCLQTWFEVGGSVLKLFTSYLTEYYLSIKIGSALSDLCKLLFGVPQMFCPSPFVVHKGIKFYFYSNNTHVYVHLSQKNTCATFEQLNRCLDDLNKWVSTNKIKLIPDKSEFIIFGSKRQRDKLKGCFDILGSPLRPVESVKNLSMIFPCLNIFRMSATVIVSIICILSIIVIIVSI